MNNPHDKTLGTATISAIAATLLAVFASIPGPRAIAQPPPREWTVNVALRPVVGLDKRTLAALNVPPDVCYALITATLQDTRARLDQLEPPARAWWQLKRLRGGHEDDKSWQQRRSEILAESRLIYELVDPWVQDMQGRLDDASRRAFQNMTDNAGLDPLVRLLPLSQSQRDAIWQATLRRDSALLNPYSRARTGRVAEAVRQYESRLSSILTESQTAQLRTYRATCTENLKAVADQERRAMQDMMP